MRANQGEGDAWNGSAVLRNQPTKFGASVVLISLISENLLSFLTEAAGYSQVNHSLHSWQLVGGRMDSDLWFDFFVTSCSL